MEDTANGSRQMHPTLVALRAIVDGLRTTLGSNAEVVLHDLSQPQSSVIAIAGEVTGRHVGSPATDLLLQLLQKGLTDEPVLNYRTTTPDGRALRSSTLFLKDADNGVIGCLCINYDLTYLSRFRSWLDEYCSTGELGALTAGTAETFARSVEDVLHEAITEVVTARGVPVPLMSKPDRLTVIRLLDDKGIFLIKNSAHSVARALGISRATLYSYLNEIHASSAFPDQ